MSNNTYNGWTNYATRTANLWITNDWRLSESYAMQAGDLLGSYEQDAATQLLAERIRDDFTDLVPDIAQGFFNDVIWASMREVNWREIAGHFVAEMVESAE